MILHRFAKALRRQDWLTVGIEFVIVVAGIYVGLEVSNWNEQRQARQLERLYLVDLTEDFETNMAEASGAEATLIGVIGDMLFLLEAAADLPADELNGRFSSVQKMPTFTNTSRTYRNLTGSGDLKLISDRRVKRALADYQRKVELIELVQQTHEQQLVVTFQPYIIENMDYLAVAHDRTEGEFPLPAAHDPDRIKELLADPTFRNVLVQKWMICADLLNQIRGLKGRTAEVTTSLNQALGR